MNSRKKASQHKKIADSVPDRPFTGANMAEPEKSLVPFRDQLGRFKEGHEGLQKRYTNAEQLTEDVIQYLEKCRDEEKNPTMSGLALSLGFRSRRSLLNYEREPGYEFAFEIIQFAKLKIEEFLEERLLDARNTNIIGLIFNLKNNFDWQDRQDIRLDQRKMTIKGFEAILPITEDAKEQ